VGAFYAYPDFSPLRATLAKRGIVDSEALCRRLLDDVGVAMLPGAAFGQSPVDLTARLAFVDFDGARALAASEKIPLHDPLPEGFVRQWCTRVVDGVERISSWLAGD